MSSSGISAQRSALFMSILSFVETGFRLITGIFGDRLPCARILVIPVVCLISSCATFSLTLSTSMAVIITYVCIAGMGRAVNYSIIFSTSIEMFGHAVHQESFSIILVSYGVGCLLAAIIPGLSFDLTGSYTPANYCGAVMWLLSAALYMGVYFLKNRKNRLRMRYTAMRQSQRATVDKSIASKIDACKPLTIAHALTEKGIDIEGALEALSDDVHVPISAHVSDSAHTDEVAVQKYFVIVDKISTV